MALSEEKIRECTKRLLLSRMRLLCNHGFYGLLLMHMVYSLDESIDTAATDGTRIIFSPAFLSQLSDKELDFVMMHEILHVALQHVCREGDRDSFAFNVACDIVVNSNILLENNMDISSITLKKYGVSMHLAPDGVEGYKYTAEEVYNLLPNSLKKKRPEASVKVVGSQNRKEEIGAVGGDGSWDDHRRWKSAEEEEDALLGDMWLKRIEDAAEAISIRDPSDTRGLLPLFAKRILEELHPSQTDWRLILSEFIQEEVVDYSFDPPDRRFDDSPFFLPDFNGKEDSVEDILFMIDTSGSMSDKMITAAYSEVKGAIDQFDGKLRGWLGFFDASVVEPVPFADEDEFKIIKPIGGGGTDFKIIFDYVNTYMQDKLPASIVILSDGYAPFPKEEISSGIPVLWLLNNDKVEPPWGKIARIEV